MIDQQLFSNFSCRFLNRNFFPIWNLIQSYYKTPQKPPGTNWKSILFQKLVWPLAVWINFSSDLKIFANSQPWASDFDSFSRSLEQCFLTVSENIFGNKVPKSINFVSSAPQWGQNDFHWVQVSMVQLLGIRIRRL